MSRSVEEWKAKHDDQAIPEKVKLRIWEREKGICYLTGRKIRPGEPFDYEHKLAICNGGEHRESNIFLALKDKHKEKTAEDRKIKKDRDRLVKKTFGMKKAKHPFTKRMDPWGKSRSGNVKQLEEL